MDFQDNRKRMLTRITEWLNTYAVNISTNSKINDQSGAIYAENNIRDLLNFLCDLNLINGNEASQNIKGIDLIDYEKKHCIQITVTKTKDKVQKSLKKTKELLGDTSGWHFKMMFLSIEDDAIKKLKKDDSLKDDALSFDPDKDLWNFTWIKRQIDNLEMDCLTELYNLCEKMFGTTMPSQNIEKLSVQYLTAIPPQTTLYGRDQELQSLEKSIRENQRLVLVNGLGGIGKSALARKLFNQLRDQYERIGWIPYKDNLKDSLLSSITLPALQTIEQPEQRFAIIYQELLNNKKTLLFIDDVTADSSEDEVLDQLAGMDHISLVLTSRREYVEKFDTFPIDSLKAEDCVELFYAYYAKPKKEQDLPIVEQLVEWAYYHTLTIELLAKAARRERNLNTYFTKLQENGFAAPRLKVNNKTVEEHIQMLYRMADFEEGSEPYRILWNLALMPTMDIPTEVEEWISADVNDFEDLIQRGWIVYHEGENSGSYFMHGLIKEIILLNRIDGKIPEKLSHSFLKYVNDGDYFSSFQLFLEKRVRYFILQSVLHFLVEPLDVLMIASYVQAASAAAELTLFYDAVELYGVVLKTIRDVLPPEHQYFRTIYENLGSVYRDMGLLEKALSITLKALQLNQIVFADEETMEIAENYMTLSLIYSDMDDFENANMYCEKALSIYRRVSDTNSYEIADIYNVYAVVCQKQGRYKEAEKYYLNALPIMEKRYGNNHPKTSSLYNNLATLNKFMGHFAKAGEYYKQALIINEKIYGPNHPETARTYNNMGLLYLAMGKLENAEQMCLKSLEVNYSILGEFHPETASSYNSLASVYYGMERYEDAEANYIKALHYFEDISCESKSKLGAIYNNLAVLYQIQKRFDESEKYLSKALQMSYCIYGEENSNTATAFHNMAELYAMMGIYNKAEDNYLKAVYINEKVLGKDHPNTRTTYIRLIKLYHSMKRYEEEECYLNEMLESNQRVWGDDHVKTRESYLNLANFYRTIDNKTKAEACLLKVLSILEQKQEKNNQEVAMICNNLAILYLELNRINEAEKYLLKAADIFENADDIERIEAEMVYKNLSDIYINRKDYDRAQYFLLKAYRIVGRIQGFSNYYATKMFMELINMYDGRIDIFLSTIQNYFDENDFRNLCMWLKSQFNN